MTARTDDARGARQGGVLDALFGDLDDGTRQKYGLKSATGDSPAPRRNPDQDANPAGAPARFRLSDIPAVAKETVAQIGEDRVTAVAGGVTFFGLLSLFPAITAFVSIYGLMADPATISQHLSMLKNFMPESALSVIRTQVESIANAPGQALSLAGIMGLAVALYSANGGMKAILSALNVALFQSESRGFLKLNLVAMCFTLCGLLLLALMLVVIAVVPAVLRWLPGIGAAQEWIALLRWPLMFTVLLLALAAIYRWGPSRSDLRWKLVSPGAVFAAVALVTVSALFSWYAANFANYNETYGSLGAAIGLMMWLWLSATVVLIGAELNSAIERQLRLREGRAAPKS